jgi:hypothetical protein
VKPVQTIEIRSHGQRDTLPCNRILLLTFGNETSVRFAGHVVTNQILSALHQSGFDIVDPGRVREVMLSQREFMQGEISTKLRSKLYEELGVDFILTGTVSHYTTIRSPQMLDEPTVTFEARLIDARQGNIVWARAFAREGKDTAWILNFGHVYGLGTLSNRMARKLARAIPAIHS